MRIHADVAQLVEHHLAKVRVAGSSPVIRSEEPGAPSPSISWWVGREVRHRPAKPFTPVRIRYPPRAIGAAGARFPDTEEVTGSIPVSPTRQARSMPLRAFLCSGHRRERGTSEGIGRLMSRSVAKGPRTLRPHEREPWNHAVVPRVDESGRSLCHRSGHPAPLLTPGGAGLAPGISRLAPCGARSAGRFRPGPSQIGYCTRVGCYWPTFGCTARRSGARAVRTTPGQYNPTFVQYALSATRLTKRAPSATRPSAPLSGKTTDDSRPRATHPTCASDAMTPEPLTSHETTQWRLFTRSVPGAQRPWPGRRPRRRRSPGRLLP